MTSLERSLDDLHAAIEDLSEHIEEEISFYALLNSRLTRLHSDEAGPLCTPTVRNHLGPAHHSIRQEVL